MFSSHKASVYVVRVFKVFSIIFQPSLPEKLLLEGSIMIFLIVDYFMIE